ncbi:SH3 domain-containing protein [Aliiroseovarius sp. PTFE2010]|uniref:SH3 domain-containing protein n=1 Tax=Aliiroseovarius sp. PTFE2010 TaxID=3417190 RepID=UPI003CF175D1
MFKLIMTTLVGIGLVLTIGGRDVTDAEMSQNLADDTPAVTRAQNNTSEIALTAVAVQAPQVLPKAQLVQPASAAKQGLRQLEIPAVFAASAASTGPDAGSREMKPEPSQSNVFVVSGSRVNVRAGPSTQFGVVGQVIRGDLAMVVEETSNGWARIRIEGDGVEGYMSTRFLDPAS